MTKKTLIRRLALCAALAALIAGIAIVLAAAQRERDMHTCEGLDVILRDSLGFVTAEDVQKRLSNVYGSYIGQKMDSLNLARIEEIIDAQSAVSKSEAYTTTDGRLHIMIWQREPVIRFQNGADGFYADSRGYIFPLQERSSIDVPIVDGSIPVKVGKDYKGEAHLSSEAAWIRDVIAMMDKISSDKRWKNFFVQYSVNSDGDLVLVPAQGQEFFLFGPPEDVTEKLERIEKYYQYILPSRGEGYYRTVNVKYKGQIICKK